MSLSTAVLAAVLVLVVLAALAVGVWELHTVEQMFPG